MTHFTSLSHTGGRLIYLATPYSKRKDKDVAAGDAARWLGYLASRGLTAVSPIVMGHTMPDRSAAEWMAWCKPIFDACGCVVVPAIAGRDESVGIKQEIAWAEESNKPVIWLPHPGGRA